MVHFKVLQDNQKNVYELQQIIHFSRRVDTGLTENTRLTEIRQSRLFSNFNSTLHNLRVLKYNFEIVTIV